MTVALGGDIAKEAGILPDAAALQPVVASTSLPPPNTLRYKTHRDTEKSFEYPEGWQPQTVWRGNVANNYYVSPSGAAAIYYLAPYVMGSDFKLQDFVNDFVKAMEGRGNFIADKQESTTVNNSPAVMTWYTTSGDNPAKGVALVIQRGQTIYYIGALSDPDQWDSYEPYLLECLKSYSIPIPSDQ